MNKFTQIVEAQNGTKAYSYDADVKVKGIVFAQSEGDAGGIIDSQLKAIKDVDTWEIGDIAESQSGSTMESLNESAALVAGDAPAFQYGAGRYIGIKDAAYDRWALNLSEGATVSHVEVLVGRYLKLNPDAVYVFCKEAGDNVVVPVSASRIRTK